MTAVIRAFWWSPIGCLRSMAETLRFEAAPWLYLAGRGGGLPRNFGDEFAPYAIREATGRCVRRATPQQANLLSIGSIIEHCALRGARNTQVWGSGLRVGDGPRFADDFGMVGQFLAVRGPLTASRLGVQGAALGDPGVLAADFRPSGRRIRSNRLLLIPHFRDFSTRQGRRNISFLRSEGLDVMLPTTRPLEAIGIICRAGCVVTSSLHGLIFAHALGVPAIPIRSCDPNVTRTEPSFKYRDYAATAGGPITTYGLDEILHSGARMRAWRAAELSVGAFESAAIATADGLRKAARDID